MEDQQLVLLCSSRYGFFQVWTKNYPVWELSASLLHHQSLAMYVILVYDMNQKRVGKMLKLCRRYLSWIQNSVFEGAITEVKLKELKHQAEALMEEGDSLILFKSRDEKWLDKEVIGEERNPIDNVL